MDSQIDIRDEFLDLESLSESILDNFHSATDREMLKLFIDMDSEFEFIEFERWLIDE